MKLRAVNAYKSNDLPDHVIEEVSALAAKMGAALQDLINAASPNIVLGALNFVHAAATNQLVVDDEDAIDKAAMQQASALHQNIKHCHKLRKEMKNDNI